MKNIAYILIAGSLLFSCNSSVNQVPPKLIVAPDRMNVLYIGVENPLSIAVSGIPDDKIISEKVSGKTDDKYIVSISNGSLTGMFGKFIAKNFSFGIQSVMIRVSKRSEEGKLIVIDSVECRIKRLPDPMAFFANSVSEEGVIKLKKEKILHQTEVKVYFPIDFNLIPKIKSFDMKVGKSLYSSSNNLLTDEMKEALSASSVGTTISIENVKVLFPGGHERKIVPIHIEVM